MLCHQNPHLWVWIMGQLVPGKSLDTLPRQGRGTVQHAGSHVNFKSYFRLGRVETAGWWSFPPASSRGVCLQQHSPGPGGCAGVSQASTSAPSSHKTAWRRAAAAPQPGRTCLAIWLCQIPKATPLYLATWILLFPFPRDCAAPRGAGTSREVDPDGLAQQHPHPQGGTEVWHGEGHTDTAQGFLCCSCCS